MSAPRLLGSNLLAATLASKDTPPTKAATSCWTIDQALNGGFDYGSIASIAGAIQADKTILALNAVVGHLISHQETDVAFIYTSETSLPIQLHTLLTDRLKSQRETSNAENALEDKVSTLLGHVRLMRAFDFIGITESIGELSEAWSLAEERKSQKRKFVRRPEEVPNSQDSKIECSSFDTAASVEDSSNESGTRGIGMIVIDNIANVLGAEMSNDQTGGQAILTSFFRSLHHLTRHFKICTIIITDLVLSSGPNASHSRVDESISVFPVNLGKPALGLTFEHLLDLSTLVSEIPRTRTDAENAYASVLGKRKPWRCAKIFEVVGDRHSVREGHWGAFLVRDETHIDAFEEGEVV